MVRTVVALRQSAIESTLKAVAFDRLRVPAACLNAAGQILAANAALGAVVGLPGEPLVGRSLFELAAPARRAGIARRWDRLLRRLERHAVARGVVLWEHGEDRRFMLQVEAQRIHVADQATVVLTLREVGAERRARREEAVRRAALAAAESPGFLIAADRRILAFNAAAESIREADVPDLKGLPFDYLLDEASAETFRRDFERIGSGTETEVERDLRLRPGGGAGAGRRYQLALTRCVPRSAAAVLAVLREQRPAAAVSTGRQARRLEFRERLLQLAVEPRREFAPALSRLLRAAAESLDASAAGFWRLEAGGTRLRCESIYLAAPGRFAHELTGAEMPPAVLPDYMARLQGRQPVRIDDLAGAGPLAKLREQRLWVDVRSLLDAPVLVDGEVRGILTLYDGSPRRWDDDEVDFAATTALMIALAVEAAHRQEAETRVEKLAWYDTLTGLPNRNLLREMLRDMVQGSADRQQRIAVMLIDLDRFKDVNDTLGHLVGDALIRSAAQVLREIVGRRGVVGRLGGDEFVVVLNDFEHRQEVAQFAARITQALHRTDLVPNIDTQVSASIGVALFPEHGREMSTLMKNADAAMYQAKRDGRNQFSFFNPIRHEHAAREVQLGIQLLKALHGGAAQFFVEYQPQVQLGSGRVVGLEALIRWQHPTYGRLTPDRFIGVAEASGLSERITRWLVGEVCAQIVRWRARQPGFDIPIAINVAGRELGSAALPAIVRAALRQHGVEPSMIVLEVTERTLVRPSDVNNDVMAELASIGVGLVLDDFGTGYSMLGYLKRMPIQALKIDGSFIEGVPGDADSCAIVHAVLAVARHFRLKVIAEGIETAAQVAYLRSVGCEYAQGFYYSQPLLPQAILDCIELGPSASVDGASA